MFKIKLTLAISSLITVTSFNLSAASLDVHGDIKINGKTIIDDTGKFVTQDDDLINYKAYQPTEKKLVQLKHKYATDNFIFSFHYDETGREYQEDEYKNGALKFFIKWGETKDNQKTTESENYWGNVPTSYKATDTIVLNTSNSAKIGQVLSDFSVVKRKYTEHSDSNLINSESDLKTVTYFTLVAKTTYDFKGETLTDCVIYEFDAQWMDDSQIRTMCKGYGIVQMGDYELYNVD